MKKILVLSSFMTILFSLNATASTEGFVATRTISGEVEIQGHELIGPEQAAILAMEAACKEAIDSCQKATSKECAVFKSESNFGSTGYVIAPSDFKCWADLKEHIASEDNGANLWKLY